MQIVTLFGKKRIKDVVSWPFSDITTEWILEIGSWTLGKELLGNSDLCCSLNAAQDLLIPE